jgi:hypothetical protein
MPLRLGIVTALEAVIAEAVIVVVLKAAAAAPVLRDLPLEASHRRITPRQNRPATVAAGAGVAIAMAGVVAIVILAAGIRTAAVTRSSKRSRRAIMRTECSTA